MSQFKRRMLMALAAFFMMGVSAWAQDTVTVTYQGPVLIPDNPSDTELILPITVNKAINIGDNSGAKVLVTVDIDHPNIGDLRLILVNSTGRTRTLVDQKCDGTRNMIDFTFNTGSQPIGTVCPTGPGQQAAPQEQIDTWGDYTSTGMWRLRIQDQQAEK